jgi:altronate dehydratase
VPTSKFGAGTVTDFWSVAPEDNVATCIREGGVSEDASYTVSVAGETSFSIVARATIPYGHKIALADIAAGERVIKYGMTIGTANAQIGAGQHVHIHNIDSERGRGDLTRDEPELRVHVGPWAKWRKTRVAP